MYMCTYKGYWGSTKIHSLVRLKISTLELVFDILKEQMCGMKIEL